MFDSRFPFFVANDFELCYFKIVKYSLYRCRLLQLENDYEYKKLYKDVCIEYISYLNRKLAQVKEVMRKELAWFKAILHNQQRKHLNRNGRRKMKIKVKKRMKILISILLCLCVIGSIAVVGINAYILHYTKPYIVSLEQLENEKFDCVMILGAGLWSGEPSPMLQERLDFGVEAYKTGCTDRMLMTGDHGRKEYDEVNKMKEVAIKEGIPANQIFLDHAGFSTYESMYRAKEIFEVKKVVIVTQKYHLYRAIYNARKLGIEAYGYPAENLQYPITNDIREAIARVKDFVWCILKPEPTYLGETIPITADASLSDDKTYA